MNLDQLFDIDKLADAGDPAAIKWKGRACCRCRAVTNKRIKPRNDTPHRAEVRCAVCNTNLGWLGKVENGSKRPQDSLSLAVKYGGEYCEMCLRYKDELRPNETLYGHHVVEHHDGGSDERSNIWIVCDFCHSFITLLRKRHGHNTIRHPEVPPW